jgi:hypothetical protein
MSTNTDYIKDFLWNTPQFNDAAYAILRKRLAEESVNS